MNKVGTPVKEYLREVGFTDSDIAVENMDVEEMQQHINYLDSKMMDMSIKQSTQAVHRIARLWGIGIPPGYDIEMPLGGVPVVYYCDYQYVNRKYNTVKLYGGSIYDRGVAVVKRKQHE